MLPLMPLAPREVWGSGGCSPLLHGAALACCKPALQLGWHVNVLQKLLLLEQVTVIAATRSPRGFVNHRAG